ncbi:PRC and DUF2382 domain-containing protein [Amycolatopsis endophytica]|uniref:Uncharacterized protein (TIGR02271 family) n=1 Tax=Amycolatopsis endophytica TaxID=860233 RepID=A0A853B078_9PSEU|nr:PRC and DUF2382 domain-containing protein [Amycolatopsis endophytica]NYI88244.1 uncharacterized protein (TIGR02271 family) [Amycolatopsis endophytica]
MTGTMRPEELMENAVVDNHGNKIGKVGTVYVADDTQQPEWVTVRTGLFGHKESFVPLQGATMDRDGVHVRVSKEKVSEAPQTDGDRHLSEQESAELYRFYDMPAPRASRENRGTMGDRTTERATTPKPQPGARGRAGESMTRSEERLNVGTERVETGKVRLRKYTVTEEQQVKVPVTHEEVRLEREPITDGDRTGARIADEEQEVTLHEERPKVDKETVPVEKVRLDKETVRDEETVSGQVRKERVEIDEDTKGRHKNR